VETALKAVAEPNRRRILTLVRDGELSAGEIASHFDISAPAISQHLKVLKEAGLVEERRNGTQRLYSVRPEGFDEVRRFFEGFWNQSLLRLKYAAEADERNKRRKHGRNQ
jgi:Predicted transcriptional regulators